MHSLSLPIARPATERKKHMSYPLANSSRNKTRTWPLVLRFHKGAIHSTILFPIAVHAILTAIVVYIDTEISSNVTLPSSIIPSLSIVVGLMLVFRNQTAYSRYWNGRLHLSTITTAIRCLSRQILVLSPAPPPPRRGSEPPKPSGDPSIFIQPPTLDRAAAHSAPNLSIVNDLLNDTEEPGPESKVLETVNILIAMLYAVKNHMRSDWGVALSPGMYVTNDGEATIHAEYSEFLPENLRGYEHKGLGLTLELTVFVEAFIARGVDKGWFHNAAASSMLGQLNTIVEAYGSMEVIRLTPVPVAHLIHHKQTLALFCTFLPFAMAAEMGWWAVPLVAFVAFTLYGIEGIAQTFEDPFGVAKNDIPMTAIVEDARRELEVLISVWQNQNLNRLAGSNDNICNMFVPQPGFEPASSATSIINVPPPGDSSGDKKAERKGSGVRWADYSGDQNGHDRGSGSGSTLSPGASRTGDGPYGARRVTWGSSVGEGDQGSFEAAALLGEEQE